MYPDTSMTSETPSTTSELGQSHSGMMSQVLDAVSNIFNSHNNCSEQFEGLSLKVWEGFFEPRVC